MKSKIISYFLFMLAISIASCGDDDKPITDPATDDDGSEIAVNSFVYKDKTVEAKSVICTDHFKGYYCVYMSPLMNLTTVEDFVASGREYVTFLIPQSNINKELSLMNSDLGCTFYYMDENSTPILESNDDDTWVNVSAGNISLNLTDENQDGKFEVKGKFDITFKDGKLFKGEIACTYTAPIPLSNQVAFDEEYIDIKSTYATVIEGYLMIYLCPTEGLTDIESIIDTENFITLQINPNKVGQVIDITTEESSYTLYNLLDWESPDAPEYGTPIANSTWNEHCVNGTMQVDAVENNTTKFSFDITMSSGKTFKGAYNGPCTIDIPEQSTTNILTVNDITRDIKSAFYIKNNEMTSLYLTPSEISNLEYINDIKSYYVYVSVPDVALDGQEIDLSTAEEFYVMYYNPSSDEMVYVNQDEPQNATGTYSIKAIGNAEDEYEVTINVEIGDYKIVGNYSGKFLSDAPPVKENEYYLVDSDGDTSGKAFINSVIIDKKTDVDMCGIYLSQESGLTSLEDIKAANHVIIRIKKPVQEGEQFQSFSNNPSMSITYKGTTYNKESANNNELDGGNATVTLEADHATIEFNLFRIAEYSFMSLFGYYDGAVTIIE